MLLDIETHTLESILFHLVFISTVMDMRLLFPAVDHIPVLHRVVVTMQLECTAGEKLSQVKQSFKETSKSCMQA